MSAETTAARPATGQGRPRPPIPDHVREALRADLWSAAIRALGPEHAAGLAIEVIELAESGDDPGGPAVRVRGESDLVDRLERALYPDGPAPAAAAGPGVVGGGPSR